MSVRLNLTLKRICVEKPTFGENVSRAEENSASVFSSTVEVIRRQKPLEMTPIKEQCL